MNHLHTDAPRGHWPTLAAALLHFDLSFMLWVLLGALGVPIAESLGLSPLQKGLLVGTPVLSGALLRVPLGLLGDRLGGRRVGLAMLGFLFVPLALPQVAGDRFEVLLGVGLLLGVAGASFAVALPLASRWYPPERQGLVMGIAAAGNSGTVVTSLIAPPLAALYGWRTVCLQAMVPLAVVLLLFALMARDSPAAAASCPWRRYLAALGEADLWWFCLIYSVTFGGYVGLSSFLPLFFRDQYALDAAVAGRLTALCALVGSLLRPVGGALADRYSGLRVLRVALAGVAVTNGLVSTLPSSAVSMTVLFAVGMACLGLGNGAVFQLVPRRFRADLGVATGLVGAIGGLGGFLLPTLCGLARQRTGSFSSAFVGLALIAAAVLLTIQWLESRRQAWAAPADARPAAEAEPAAA